ncbi:MAG: exo-alpha-sialidase [Verrucomicrobia bacterium]|nr:exo-alpha-sialidase [Verrucomicrobiota bacterium]
MKILRPFALVVVACVLGICARAELELQEKVRPLTLPHHGPFVHTGDGAILGVDPKGVVVSRDEGRTWEVKPIFDSAKFEASGERAVLRTKEGVLLYAFLNRKEMVFKWDDKKGGPQEGCRLPVYVSRSEDDGRTWAAPALVQEGWCGAVRQMIQLRTGRVLLVSQQAAANPGRHVTIVYHSDDLGQTWRASNRIDSGAAGDYPAALKGIRGTTHSGYIEGTVYERAAGDLRLLLRTPLGGFFDSISRDGAQWSAPVPSAIEASDSPAVAVRLASGQLMLAWNRFADPVKRTGRREELSVAFSGNDGVTWTMPQVIAINRVPAGAREGAHWISYPYGFEVAPGKVWITTMQGPLRAGLDEADFVAPVARPLGGPAVRVIALGDSITKGARPGVLPTEAYPARVQAGLRERGLRVEVHNTGIGGERTDQALARLERDVISQRPHLVTVMYGTNDSWVDKGKTESRLSAPDYEKNLRRIVERLRAAGSEVVLMTEPRFGDGNPRNGLDEEPNGRLARYMEACRAVARSLAVPLVDHFDGWTQRQQGGQPVQGWTTDGCHPNGDGHADLAARALAVVEPLVRRAEKNL